MNTYERLHRTTITVALVLYAVFAFGFSATAGASDRPELATLSALSFLCAQVALGIWSLGVGRVLRRHAPVLGPAAAVLLFVSAFGHAAAAGFMVGEVGRTGADPYPAALNIVAAVTMLGLVGGTVVLAIALIRAKLGTAWLGVVFLAWVVVEFGLSGLGLWAWLASAALLLVGCAGLAVLVARPLVSAPPVAVARLAVAGDVADPRPTSQTAPDFADRS